MEKVKLTREQANAIEYALQEVDEYKGNPDRLLRHASMNNVNFRNELHLLDTIDIVTLAKALYIGYEVEPEFIEQAERVQELEEDLLELVKQNKRYRQALERIINIRNSSDVMFLEENSYEDIVYHIVTKVLEGESE